MDVFDLSASLTLDTVQYQNGLDQAEGKAQGFGGKLKGAFGAGAKALAVVGATAVAVGAKLGKVALDAYADYEQLEGGVKKLFGNSSDIVMKNAQEAYRTAGMSANQYMEQATSFSASLINSLGGDTKKAAEQTDVAMRAISDNYNTFGGDMSMIQGAFQGFAKQNYTMLDNLKLGYGGTKSEMERLIADANEWGKANGKASDLSIDSFSDVVTAIDYIQQKQNIAGTTAREASTTIAGSIGQVKGAWENLMAGLANPDADIAELAKNLTSSIATASQNILPAIGQIAQGFAEATKTLIPQLLTTIVEGLPDLVMIGGQVIQSILEGITTAIPMILETLPKMLEMGTQMVTALINGVVQAIPTIATALANNAEAIVTGGVNLIIALVNGLIKAIPKIIEALPKIIMALVKAITDNLPRLIMAGVKLIVALAKGLIQAIPQLIKMAPKIVLALAKAIISLIGQLIMAGARLIAGLVSGIGSGISKAVAKAKEVVTKIWSAIKNAGQKFLDVGMNIVKGIWNGISNGLGWIKGQIKGWVGNVKAFIKKIFGIKSPSKWARDEIGWNIAKGLALGIEDGQNEVDAAVNSLMPDVDTDIGISTSRTDGMLQDLKKVDMVNNITVDGSENPEEFATRFVNRLKLEMRTI